MYVVLAVKSLLLHIYLAHRDWLPAGSVSSMHQATVQQLLFSLVGEVGQSTNQSRDQSSDRLMNSSINQPTSQAVNQSNQTHKTCVIIRICWDLLHNASSIK